MRRDLVANVSHELRTPISALQAVLENLVDGVEPAGPERRCARRWPRPSGSGGSSAQLLDLSRVEAGVVPLRLADVDVTDLLDDAVAQARVDSLRYTVVVEPPDLRVPATPTGSTS